jgi:hypothetical protein
MKIQLHWLMAPSLFSARWLQSQDVVGTWQGTLQADKDLRLVLKVSKADAGILKTTMYSIDEGGQSTAADASLRESIFKVTVPGVGEAYEGKLSADSKTITGSSAELAICTSTCKRMSRHRRAPLRLSLL